MEENAFFFFFGIQGNANQPKCQQLLRCNYSLQELATLVSFNMKTNSASDRNMTETIPENKHSGVNI